MEVFHYVVDRMWNGNIRLSKIFWGYFVIGGFLWGIAIGLTRPNTFQQTAVFFFSCAYYVVISVGIWRAANKYKGNVWWAGISKLYGIGGFLYSLTIGASLLSIALGVSNGGAREPSAVANGQGADSRVDNRSSQVGKPADTQSASRSEQNGNSMDEQLALMDSLRPSWRDTVRSRDFQSWLASQPKGFRDAFDSADTAAKLIPFIDLYSQYGGGKTPQMPRAEKTDGRRKTAEEIYAEQARKAMIDNAAEGLSINNSR